jgi:hypothetical protein
MALDFILYILVLMIFYDWSIHLLHLFHKEERVLKRGLNWWPKFLKDNKFDSEKYQRFWSVYWGTAFVLILIYMLTL